MSLELAQRRRGEGGVSGLGAFTRRQAFSAINRCRDKSVNLRTQLNRIIERAG